MVGNPVPDAIMTVEVVGILGVSAVVVASVLLANVYAVQRLRDEGGVTSPMHWFPSWFALLLSVESIALSYTGVYELYLDQLYAPSAPAIVLPILVGLVYSWRSETLRELLRYIPEWWLFLPHLTRFSGFAILALMWEGVLPAHVGWPIGGGDILCAVLAIPAAWWVYHRRTNWRPILNAFGILGIVDYVLALQLTVFTLPLPIRLLHSEIDSTVLAFWPVGIAPTLYVPLLYLTLFAMFIKARA